MIVYATGYGSMNGWAAELTAVRRWPTRSASAGAWVPVPPRIPGPWEGEQRNMWKPTQQEALWFHGGNLHQSRHYSQFLARPAEGAVRRASRRRCMGCRRRTTRREFWRRLARRFRSGGLSPRISRWP